jgi:hypothetical protein
MEGNINQDFLEKLEEKYGEWNKPTAKFGSTSYGKIAQDLSISASQFSKLIYGTATEGMYVRSIENIDRIIRREKIKVERDEALGKVQQLQSLFHRKIIFSILVSLLVGAMGMYFYNQNNSKNDSYILSKDHPLEEYFEQGFGAAFDSPYLQEQDVQENCPCSAFEGEWSLEQPFKLPLPGSRQPGLYYIAKQADMRMRCSNVNAPYVEKGKAMIGYEYLISEIWLDTEQEPLIPKYFDIDKKTYTSIFTETNFEEHPQFKRVAVMHAFNVNNFEIHADSIVRRAEITGRYVSDLDETLAKEYEIDVKHIVQNVLGNLTKTNCETAHNLYCDPNTLVEGQSTLTFDCIYTIEAENLGLGGGYPYTKAFRLEKQHYSDYLNCECSPR